MTVDITTTGRQSRQPRRIEIWMFEVGGRYVITGTPGPRDWYANLLAEPALTVHLDQGVELAAVASPVRDVNFRRSVFTAPHTSWYLTQTALDDLIATSPMVELSFPSLRGV